MDDISGLIALFLIVFGVLQIVLFFKIWEMTTNISEIKNRIFENDYTSDANYYYLLGDIDKAEKLLNEAFLKEISNISSRTTSEDNWAQNFEKLKSKYSKAFEKINRESPDFNKYSDWSIYLL